VQTERDGTRAETRFGLSAKRTSPFISAGVSVQSSTGFLVVTLDGLFRVRMKPASLPNPFASFPFTSPPVRRRVPPDSVTTLLQRSRLIVLTLSPPPVWTFPRSPPGTSMSTTTPEILVEKDGTLWARIGR